MPNVTTLNRFASEQEYIAEMRWLFNSNSESVRIGYAQLVEKLAELITTERLLREEVLSGDDYSASSRLRGVLLLYNRVGLESVTVHRPAPQPVADSTKYSALELETADGKPALLYPDMHFAILASFTYWLADSIKRFHKEAAETYGFTEASIADVVRFYPDQSALAAKVNELLCTDQSGLVNKDMLSSFS